MKKLEIFIKVCYWLGAALTITPVFSRIIIKLYDTFRESAISFTLDTLYLNWNTTFPSVTVCEIYNGEKNWDISEKYFGENRDHRIDDFVTDVTFFAGKCDSCFYCDDIDCPDDFYELIETFRTSCNLLITNCSWLGISFECCDEFRPLHTEYGLCYSFNSMQTPPFKEPKFINNRQTGPGQLSFLVNEDIQIHMHPPNEIPYLFAEGVIKETVLWGTTKEIVFNIIEIVNDPTVESFSPEHRKCRFMNELPEIDVSSLVDAHLYKYYSYSTCIVECMKSVQLLVCQCASHFMPHHGNESYYSICDVDGLKCLTENYDKFVLHRQNECNCLSSCEEPEYNVIYTSLDSVQETNSSSIVVSMIQLPTQRYLRNVVKTNLDLIISIGGIAGLFFGASFLSVLELIYKFILFLGRGISKRRISAVKKLKPKKIQINSKLQYLK